MLCLDHRQVFLGKKERQSFSFSGPNPKHQRPARVVSLSSESLCLGLRQCGQEAEGQLVVHICQLDFTSQKMGFIFTRQEV